MILDPSQNKIYNEKDITEKELQKFIASNFYSLFPEIKLLDTEFILQGDVRQFGISGRIDILGFNQKKKQLVIFELKKAHAQNILVQAIDYLDFINHNQEIILSKIKNLTSNEKNLILSTKSEIEIILIAKHFQHPTIRRIEKIPYRIRLFSYKMYSDDFFQLSEVVQKNNKINKLEPTQYRQPYEDSDIEIIRLIKEILYLGLLDDKYYKLENNSLIINPTKLYEIYREFILDKNNIPLSKSEFIYSIKSSQDFIKIISSIRFNNNRTSALSIKI